MTSPRRVPSNWVLEDIGGDQIKGTNIVTKETFSGTITLSNPAEMTVYQARKWLVAQAIADVLGDVQ